MLNILSQVNSELSSKIGYKIEIIKEVESKFGEDKIVERARLIKITSRKSRN